MTKRTISLVISVMMVFAVLLFAVSCNPDKKTETTATDKKTDVVTTEEQTETETVTETEEQTTEIAELTGYEKMPDHEDVDFGGMTFLIASYAYDDQDWANASEFWVESITNDAINDAVYDRNDVMSKLYNCKIDVDDGGWNNGFNASVASGDGKYIAGSTACYGINGVAKSGNYYNLLKLDVDWSQSWWDQNYINDSSTDGKLFGVVGDFSIHTMSATWIMFYNKDVYESKFSDIDIYEMVRNHQWTIDAMADFIDKIKNDANGDSEYTFTEGADADTIGMMTTAHNDRGLYFASGLRYVTKTEQTTDGSFVTALTNQPNAVDVIDKLIQVCNMPGYISGGYTNVQKAVQNGTTLFAGEVMDVLRRMAGADSLRVGVLPQPLFDETQTDYHCYVNNQASILVIPTSFSDMSILSDFLTLFAYHSSKLVRTAFVNTYKYTYASDEDSAEMVDIILNSRVYDVGYINSFSTDMDGYISSMISNRKNQYVNAANKFSIAATAKIDEYRSALMAVDDNY